MPLKFPDPKHCALKDMVVFCSSERIIRLYNERSGTGKQYLRLVQKVQLWFTAEAARHGWAGSKFLPSAESRTTVAGCVLRAPDSTSVHIHLEEIILRSDQVPTDDTSKPVSAKVVDDSGKSARHRIKRTRLVRD